MKKLYLIVVVSLLTFPLTACYTQQPRLDAHALSQADINAHSRDQLRRGGSITLPFSIWPDNFNPHHINGNTGYLQQMIGALLPSPMTADPHGGLHQWTTYFPRITQTFEHGTQIIRYTINPQAHWSDGSPITWRDFYYMWQALNGHNHAYPVNNTSGYEQIAHVQPEQDERHVKVIMASPYTDWRLLFTHLLSWKNTSTPEAFSNSALRQFPLTAGPFQPQSVDQLSQTVTLERNRQWWGKPALLDTIRFRMVSKASGIEPYLSREFTQLDLGADNGKITMALHSPHTKVIWGLNDTYFHLQFNCAKERITRDKTVRHAISHAINRSFLQQVYSGKVLPGQQALMGNHFHITNRKGYTDNSAGYNFSPQRAQQELEQAGWKLHSNGIRYKNGKPLHLNLIVPNDTSVFIRALHQAIQSDLLRVGIAMSVRTVPVADFFGSYVVVGNFDVTLYRHQPSLSLVDDARRNFYLDYRCVRSSSLYNPHSCNIQGNYGLGGSKQINSLITALPGILDRQQLHLALDHLDTILWDAMYDLPLFQQPIFLAQDARLANYGNNPLGTTEWENVGWLKKTHS